MIFASLISPQTHFILTLFFIVLLKALVKNIGTCSFKRRSCGDSLFETTRVITYDFNVCVSYNAFDRSGTRKKVTLDIKNDQTDENLKMWFDLKQSDDTNSHSSGAVAFINHFGDDNRLLPLFKNPIQLKTGEITLLRLVTNEVNKYSKFQVWRISSIILIIGLYLKKSVQDLFRFVEWL